MFVVDTSIIGRQYCFDYEVLNWVFCGILLEVAHLRISVPAAHIVNRRMSDQSYQTVSDDGRKLGLLVLACFLFVT